MMSAGWFDTVRRVLGWHSKGGPVTEDHIILINEIGQGPKTTDNMGYKPTLTSVIGSAARLTSVVARDYQ